MEFTYGKDVVMVATCKECVHNNICNIKQRYNHPKYELQHIEKYCQHFKDHSRFVEVVCNIGSVLWFLPSDIDKIRKITVVKITIFDDDIYYECEVKNSEFNKSFSQKFSFGKSIFLTKEQAEQALKECKNNGDL